MTTDRARARSIALDHTLQALGRRFGPRTVARLGDPQRVAIEVVSSGCLALDAALGIGGYPRGRVIEIYGQESCGKTTLSLHAIAEHQKAGGTAVFIDAEHALDIRYAAQLGVDTEALLVSQPSTGEQALEITEALVRSGAVDLVVIDSVAALVPQAEIDGEMGEVHLGLQARLMSQALRKLTSITHKTGCTVIFINQVRHRIGVIFGNSQVTSGGNALKFYASIRMEVRRLGTLTQGEQVVGHRTKIKVVKNKLAPPFREVEVALVFGRGVCRASELLAMAERAGLITRSGSWYSWSGEKLGQGREAVRERLLAQPELLQRLGAALQQLAEPAAAK